MSQTTDSNVFITLGDPWPDQLCSDALQGRPDVLCELRTDSACTRAIHIHQGKHLLRVLVNPDHAFHLAVSSEADFAIGMASEVRGAGHLCIKERKLTLTPLQLLVKWTGLNDCITQEWKTLNRRVHFVMSNCLELTPIV